MLRPFLIALAFIVSGTPSFLFASDALNIFDTVTMARQEIQPGLQNYLVTVETSRIKEVISNLTTGIPADVEAPPLPVITKFWQRDGKGLILIERVEQAPYVEKIARQVSNNLAVELNEIILPSAKKALREELLKSAGIKTSEVALTDNLIQQVIITFAQPTDLNEAFYLGGMRLPQKQVKSLSFDIDTRTSTVTVLSLVTASGLHLTAEIRYIDVAGGQIPERFQITSPDGKIDDRFEVKFINIEGFSLPESMTRTIRRPELEEDLEVLFKNYRINQPVTDAIKARLNSRQSGATDGSTLE
jgi:hypothetical protein